MASLKFLWFMLLNLIPEQISTQNKGTGIIFSCTIWKDFFKRLIEKNQNIRAGVLLHLLIMWLSVAEEKENDVWGKNFSMRVFYLSRCIEKSTKFFKNFSKSSIFSPGLKNLWHLKSIWIQISVSVKLSKLFSVKLMMFLNGFKTVWKFYLLVRYHKKLQQMTLVKLIWW